MASVCLHFHLFSEKYKSRFNEIHDLAKKKDSHGFFTKTKELLTVIEQALKNAKILNYTTSLSDYSPFLSSFNKCNHFETIELFGQYHGDVEPNPNFYVKIAAFGSKVSVFSSLRKPIKLSIIGTKYESTEIKKYINAD